MEVRTPKLTLVKLTPNIPVRSLNELRAAQISAKLIHISRRLNRFNRDVKAGLPVGPTLHWKSLHAARKELEEIVRALLAVIDEFPRSSSIGVPLGNEVQGGPVVTD